MSGCQIINTPKPVNTETNKTFKQPEEIQRTGINTHQGVNKKNIVQKTTYEKPVIEIKKTFIPIKTITPQERDNLWDRIAHQLHIPVPENERVKRYRDWYLKNPRHLQLVAERAKPFLYLITEKIEQEGLPLELALLPIVESSFDQFAYSHGSAAGIWQFIPDTARRFGLEQNFWYDGRRDIVASTDAAIGLLRYLHKKFNGDWLHALAAYNTGEWRVFKAIRNNREQGLPTDFWSLKLPKETRAYVPKLLAVANIVKTQHNNSLVLPNIQNEKAVELVDLDIQLDLAMAAEFAGISLVQIQNLNPAYNHWSTAPTGGAQDLLLPKENINTFMDSLSKNSNKGIKLERYKVKEGDSLGLIAQRNNTTVNVIKRTNNLTRNIIRTGQYLMVPISVKDRGEQSMTISERMDNRMSIRSEQYKLTHRVRHGDSLWLIAKKYKVSVNDLVTWNRLPSKTSLIKGDEILVWKKTKMGEKFRKVIYEIKEGDSLSIIAHRFNISVDDILNWNAIPKDSFIVPGQKLTLHINVKKA